MTVAVLYDKSLEKDGFNKDELIKAVKSIVGWDPARDNETTFSSMVGDFAAESPIAVESGPGLSAVAMQWGPIVGQVVGVVLVLMFLKSLMRTTPRSSSSSDSSSAAAAVSNEAAEASLPPEEQQKRMRREIERAISGDPATLAKMLESWLSEQRA